MEKVRFITFNLRFENDLDGPDSWVNRRDFVVRLIRKYSPGIIGSQEGKNSQLLFLEEQLSEYSMQATNRVTDEKSQYPTLFIRKASFDILEGEEFWLSRTPGIHLSKDWDSAFPRMMSAARVKCRSSGFTFWAVVTHLDHLGTEARYRQAELLAGWVSKRTEPVVVMGDFNDAPGSRAHDVLTSGRAGLIDTWLRAGREEGESSYTHHGFEGIPGGARMDWILASGSLGVEDVRILRDAENGRYPSDHFPFLADLSFPAAAG